jgi:steroid 5-alpha reductase family enzyme
MTRALSYCALAYALALAAAVGVAHALHGAHPLWVALAADVAATLLVFAFSVAFGNSSLYDPYWSVAPVPLGIYFALQPTAAHATTARAVLVILLVLGWGARLTYNFLRGWQGLSHEDWRYVDLRHKTGRAYWLVSLLGIHLFPTLIVFAGCLPLYAAFANGTRPLNLVDAVASLVVILAIAIEAVADAQLRRFKLRAGRQPEEILDRGLWAWSRHPNYFGEMSFWWGVWLFALASGPGHAWTVVGAIAITAMFHSISLRLIETRMLTRRPAYAERTRNVPAFLPYRRRAK